MPPFVYSPYHNDEMVARIGDLIARQGTPYAQAAQTIGNAQANAALQSGAAWSGAAQQIGQSVGQLPQQIQAARSAQLRDQDVAAQIADRQTLARQRDAAQKGLAVVDQLMQTSMKTDPETGVTTFDRPTFEAGLAKSGQGHLYPQYAEMLDKLDASAAKRNAEGRQMLAQSIYGVASHGYTPEAVLSAAAYLKANHIATDDHLAPILAMAVEGAPPDAIKSALDQVSSGIPEYRQLVEAEATKKATLEKTQADTAKANAEAARTNAEVAGTLPATTAQIETARHNAAMEQIQRMQVGREAAANAETARHNRAMEQANNPLAALTSGQGQSGAGAQPEKITGDAFLKTLPDNIASQVKALAEGRMQFPGGFALKSPYWQSMISAVSQYDPTFDTTNFNARNATRKDLTSPNGTGGKTINALNTAIQHAGKLSDLIEALGNNDIPAANYIANAWNRATGGTKVTNFEAVQPQLMKEIERAWRGTGGSQKNIEDLKSSIGSNAGIQQQREALQNFVDLMKGKLQTVETQRDNALGPNAATQIPVLFDQSKPILDKIQQRASGKSTVERWERGPDGKLRKVGG